MELRRFALVVFIVMGLLHNGQIAPCMAETNKDKPSSKAEKERGTAPGHLDANTERQISEQRKKVIQEAVSAVAETRAALRALEKKKLKEALANLERASGKLNIVLARDPELSLAPIDVDVKIYDVNLTTEAIQNATKVAKEFLEEGELQKARLLIRNLASEIVISVVHLPLKTYPAAISAAAPLIDQGRFDDAKAALRSALNTLVVADHIIALPLTRTGEKLSKAEQLSEKQGRSEEDNKILQQLLNEAREQLKLAEALGYGSKEEYEQFHAEIDDIENRTQGGKAGKGWFEKVKQHLTNFTESIFG